MPTYKLANRRLLETGEQVKFEISNQDFDLLKKFIGYVSDDRVFLMKYNTEPMRIKVLNENLKNQNNFKFGERSFKNVDLLIQRFFDYLNVIPEEFKNLKELEEEIRHFKNIKVYLKDINDIQKKIERVKDYPGQIRELQEQYGKISPQEYTERAKNLRREEDFETAHKKIKIKYVANHYYLPLILSEDEKVDYIKHIIRTQSEVRFINDLEDYLSRSDNRFKGFDWWLFSKLDESLDKIYIPYYNPNANKITEFYPDFIFWLKRGDNYFIVFVDPKGIEHISGWEYKINNGYRQLFEENGNKRLFNYDGLKVKIDLQFRTDDVSRVPPGYKQYWFDRIGKMLEVMV